MKKLPLHWKIVLGIVLGIGFGLLAVSQQWQQWVVDWVKPFGSIFINLLKVIAVPLIITSLIKGISDMRDVSSLSHIGGRTLGWFLITTLFAIVLGLILVNLVEPGKVLSEQSRTEMMEKYGGDADNKIAIAQQQKGRGPLQPLVDMVPDNIFAAASKNNTMLQVIFFVIFFGIGLMLIPADLSKPVRLFFSGAYEVVLKMIDLIMLYAPYGVFALLATLIVEMPTLDLIRALLSYSLTLLLGLAILVFLFYPLLIRFFTKRSYRFFMKGIAPAQLVAFSTSSSAATLPVTMECAQKNLGVDEEVSSFVMPIGVTLNMDGTALHQALAAVFIAQAFGIELSLATQLGILLTAVLSSIGASGTPSSGLILLVIVLGQAGIPEAGLGLIVAVDRPLDMCRTIVNISGDAAVSMLVANGVGKLGNVETKDQ